MLWIGYLQWHIRTPGNKVVTEPVVHDYGSIEHSDAVLAWSETDLPYDDGPNGSGPLLSRWDGKIFKTHPVTAAPVPDEAALVPQCKYILPTQAKWPKTVSLSATRRLLAPAPCVPRWVMATWKRCARSGPRCPRAPTS